MLNDRSFKSRTLISIATWRLSSLKSSGPVCCVPCSLQTFLTLFLPDQLCALEVPFHSWQSVSSILKCHNTFGKLNVDHVSYEFYMKFVHKKKKNLISFLIHFPIPQYKRRSWLESTAQLCRFITSGKSMISLYSKDSP